MKKTILTLIAIVSMSGLAFAAMSDYPSVADGLTLGSAAPTLSVKGSKGVGVMYTSEATAGQGYILGASHASGTQTYASSSGDTKIYKQDGTYVNTPTTAPVGSNTVDFTGAGWVSM